MNTGTRRGDRAQTTLDFAVGITVFLITTAFVFTFIPGMLDPFTGGLEEETVAANRVADSLVLGTLGDPDEPYVLDRECTIAFFEDEAETGDGDAGSNVDGDGFLGGIYDDTPNSYDAANCNFGDVPLVDRVGVQGRATSHDLDVRVRLVRDLENVPNSLDSDENVDTLCLDANDPRIVEAGDPIADADGTECDIDSGDDDVVLEIGTGDPPTDSGSVVVARRTAYLEGGLADGTNDVILVVEVW